LIHALLALALAASPVAPEAPPRRVLDRVAAIVNGEVVMLRELQERAGDEWRRADALPPGLERDQTVPRILRRTWEVVLAERLFHAQAVSLQMETSDGQVDAAIEDIKRRNHFDDNQLDLALAGQGLDRAGFKSQIRRELETMQVLNYRVRSRVKVTDEDLQNYYKTHPGAFGGEEELHVRHLLLPLDEKAAPAAVAAAEAQGQRLLQRLAAGEDFAALVREVDKGDGDLGWLKRGHIQKQLEDAFVGLADGQVSKLVRAGPGLHLFKVEERRRAGGRSFEEAKEEIRDTLTQEQTASYRDQYLAELKRDAVIELKLPELKD
jgi:peptidyl-prolyl cis-trans isomerase SurA